jgi:hypothetical protein
MKLIDVRTEDGSRQFACVPKYGTWRTLHEQVGRLPGATVHNFVAEGVAGPWMEFSFRGHRFLVQERDGDWWLCVRDPQCPDTLLYQVASHLAETGRQQTDSNQRHVV